MCLSATTAVSASAAVIPVERVAVIVASTTERIRNHICRRRAWANAVNQVLALLLEQGTHLILCALVAKLVDLTLDFAELSSLLS